MKKVRKIIHFALHVSRTILQKSAQENRWFYRSFQTAPTILLQLVGRSAEDSCKLYFCSVELKQTAFRIDGILVPTDTSSKLPVYFLEVQFQPDEGL